MDDRSENQSINHNPKKRHEQCFFHGSFFGGGQNLKDGFVSSAVAKVNKIRLEMQAEIDRVRAR